MILIPILLILGILCAIIGHARGIKSTFEIVSLFIVGVLCFPVGLIMASICSVGDKDSYDCPSCAERVKKKAVVCWRCCVKLRRKRRRK